MSRLNWEICWEAAWEDYPSVEKSSQLCLSRVSSSHLQPDTRYAQPSEGSQHTLSWLVIEGSVLELNDIAVKRNWQVRRILYWCLPWSVSHSVTHSVTRKVNVNVLLPNERENILVKLSVGRQNYSQIQSTTYPDCSFRHQHLPCL